MSVLFSAVAGIAGIVSIVCWILVLIKIFKDSIGLGILGIFCGIFAFIYGWIKSSEYDIKNVMFIWTLAIVVGFGANLLNVALATASQ